MRAREKEIPISSSSAVKDVGLLYGLVRTNELQFKGLISNALEDFANGPIR